MRRGRKTREREREREMESERIRMAAVMRTVEDSFVAGVLVAMA
jgi:hypothetical protein